MTYRLRNILIAVGLAGVAALLTVFYVTNARKDAEESEALVSVFVAAKDIVAGTTGDDAMSKDLLAEKEIERKSVVPGAISSPEQVEALVANETIYAGEQVTARRFQPVAEQGIIAQLDGNMRAIQVPGDENQVLAGTLRSGDRVDIIASIDYKVSEIAPAAVAEAEEAAPAENEAALSANVERTASRVVLRDILVLEAPVTPGTESGLTEGISDSSYAVLAVSDTQAQKLFFVMRNAEWSLQLRPANDAADSPESVETVESVLADGLTAAQLNQLLSGFGERSSK